FEDSISVNGVTVLIDPAAVMFLIGSEMDWQEDKFSSGFVFNNPNETARCGCGESFSVEAT
ncbi:MAG TPA: Fe-S cluster assembly scaffold SufA, partial [Alphaproteobacteria bacterium]|nr:Fe-S cluster assembly scaffold SufA [Alphaproteobacteria bacterium]